MKIERAWAMPSGDTFSIKPIKNIIERYLHAGSISIDPFSKNSTIATTRNDLNQEYENAHYHMDALDFLKMQHSGSYDVALFDPPYSPRQISELYKKLGKSVNMQTTQSSFWSSIKKEISRITRPGGICMTFGWCSNGVGKTNGFEIVEILLVAHGGWHNDTICTVEIKR